MPNYGYRISGDELVFEYTVQTNADTVTDERNGKRFRYNDLGPGTRASVAGDFNGWRKQPMQQQPRRFDNFQLVLDRRQMPAKSAFKFILDDHLWVEPPTDAPNRVNSQYGPETKNLVFVNEKPKSK